MPNLFIANGTRQVQSFNYRVPESKQPRAQTIPVGGQVRISAPDEGLTAAQIDAIVGQHRKYGLIPADEILKGRNPAPLAYRVGKHISSEEIEMLMQRNEGVLVDRGAEARKNAAIVLANTLGQSARDSGTGADFQEAEVDIVEETRRGESTGAKVEEKILATREDRPKPDGNRSRRRS